MGEFSFLSINAYFGRKLLFLPASLFKEAIDPLSDDALAPAALQDLATSKLECVKYVDYILPLRRVRGRKYSRSVPPLMNLIGLGDIVGNQVQCHHGQQDDMIRSPVTIDASGGLRGGAFPEVHGQHR